MDTYVELFIIFSVLINKCNFQMTCSSECQCKYYPRRPVTCAYNPGLTSFPANIPGVSISVSMSGTNINHNKLNRITKSNLMNLKKLQHFILDYSEVSTIEDGAFSLNSELLELSLGYNQIQTLTDKTFQGLTALTVLDLTGNRHCRIETGAFIPLTKLKKLYLGEMSLETFPKSVSSLVSLENLDLHGNEIKTLNSVMFSKLSKMQYLDISGNSIKTLLSSTENLIKRMTTVQLYDNPWHCNCQLQWMQTLPRKYLLDSGTGQSITCDSPDKLRYLILVDIPKTKLECVPPKIVNCTKLSFDVHYQSPLIVKCLITGDPFPDVVWNRPNGEKFVSGNVSAGLNISDKGYLQIQTASRVDNGVWAVKAVSDYGTDNKNIKITVIMPTTTTKSTSTTSSISTSTSKTTPIQHKTSSKIHNTPPSKLVGSKVSSGVAENNQAGGDNGEHVKLSTASSVSNPSSTESAKGKAKTGGMNMMLIAGAAGGGAFLLGLCCTLIYCLKRKKNKNKVQDIRPKKVKENFDSVKTPRQTKNQERSSRGSSMRRKPSQNQRPPGTHGGRRSVFRNDMALEALDF